MRNSSYFRKENRPPVCFLYCLHTTTLTHATGPRELGIFAGRHQSIERTHKKTRFQTQEQFAALSELLSADLGVCTLTTVKLSFIACDVRFRTIIAFYRLIIQPKQKRQKRTDCQLNLCQSV